MSLHIQPRLITWACVKKKVTSHTGTLKKKISWSFLYCLNTKTVTKTQMFENDPAYEKFTRLKQEKLNDQLFLAEFHSSTHDNTFAFANKSPFVCITQSSHNTKFCTSESFWSISTMPARQQRDQFHLIHWRNNYVTIDDEGENQKKHDNQFSKQTGYTSNISISDDG